MSSRRRAKILLADDNPRVRSFVRPALEEARFDCIEAEGGWTALEMVKTETPDLAVLDIMLGDETMSGLDVCKPIREMGLRLLVIFLTIKDRTEEPRYMERAFQLGVDDYVSKREELRRVETGMGLPSHRVPGTQVQYRGVDCQDQGQVATSRARGSVLRQAQVLPETGPGLRQDNEAIDGIRLYWARHHTNIPGPPFMAAHSATS